MCGYIGQFCHLLSTRYTSWKVAYIVYVASGWTIAINQHSVFTIVTDNCHANSMFVCHFTMDNNRGETFTTTRTDDIRTPWSSRNTVFDCSAGFGKKRFEIIIFNCLKVLIITSHMLSLKAFTPFSCSLFFLFVIMGGKQPNIFPSVSLPFVSTQRNPCL